ncbi:hypothetical protein M0D21_06965 [Aquimarina sp. D1M17]|uniref:hypothetical protein n=1 Tax=Aquimarina acroporae TaxID=2937283 RepID=UPI0020BD5C89|nr:hypothetical protein [Aquimarina acroporae]MCK8521299.1 hypothetical protein [Aquimarina acroporae]
MRQLSRMVISIFTAIYICSCASYTPKSNDLTKVLLETKQTIINLKDKVAASANDDLIDAYNQLDSKYEGLAPLLEKCNEKYALSPEYISTLQETKKTLDGLDKNFDQIDDKKFILNAIYQDFDAKMQTINNTAKNDATTKIRVVVNSGKEEGFFVFGKLSFEKEQEIKRFRFNQPTQNATQDFVPGYYLFWLEKDDRVGTPELHLIMSNSGEEEKMLVLETPKE